MTCDRAATRPDSGPLPRPRHTLDTVTRPEQVEQEARHLDAMIKALAIGVVGSPSPCSPPLPDFELLLGDGRRMGVEVTESTDPEVAAAWGGARERLQKEIVRQLERGGTNTRVGAHLRMEVLLELERTPALSRSIAEKIAALAHDRAAVGLPPINGEKLGLSALEYIELRPANRPEAWLSSSVGPDGPQRIQRAIDLKVPKLGNYRALGAHEYWLLIVGGRALSGYVTADDARSTVFESRFDRTVFLDTEDGACVILETT